MIYRPVQVEWQDTHYYNLPQDSLPEDMQPDPDPMDIGLLGAYDCPIGQSCVSIRHSKNITIYCTHLKSCVQVIEGQLFLGSLICDHRGSPINRKVKLLKNFIGCPVHKRGCIHPRKDHEKKRQKICEYLDNIIPSDSSRPHYSIVCKYLK